jgi:hyperosmotically inducible periplasmic protein
MMIPMMSKRCCGFTLAVLAVTALGVTSTTHAQQGIAGRAGEALDNVGRNIRAGVENAVATNNVAAYEQELLARVYSRIHWDKYLVGSTLEIQVQADGTAILRGAVPDKVYKDRAVVLARDTVGISKVVDELTVSPPARVIPASPAAKTSIGTTTVIKRAEVISTPTTTVIETPATTVISKP